MYGRFSQHVARGTPDGSDRGEQAGDKLLVTGLDEHIRQQGALATSKDMGGSPRMFVVPLDFEAH